MRPSTYTVEMGERICEAVATSEYGLRKTLDMDPELPAHGTVLKWLKAYPEFSSSYARAKRLQVESMAEDIIDISNDETLDANEKRIKIDTRKWLLSKLIPKTYGDKLDVTSGGEAIAPPSHQIDARIQSIIMQATQRRAGGDTPAPELDAEASRLLE